MELYGVQGNKRVDLRHTSYQKCTHWTRGYVPALLLSLGSPGTSVRATVDMLHVLPVEHRA